MRLQQHNFAGNVRELRNVLERAVTLSETSTIDASHLGLSDFDMHQEDHMYQENIAPKNQNINEKSSAESLKDTAKENAHDQSQSIVEKKAQKTKSQQEVANLHPYRTITQHYSSMTPSINQRSVPNTVESADSSIGQHIKESLIEQHDDNEGLNKPTGTKAIADIQLPAQGLEHYLQEQEKQLIITALKQTGWNKTQAAELLGTTFRSLRYRMSKLDIAEDQSE